METYPADARVQKSPPNSVFKSLLHPPTSIEKYCKHALPQFNYADIFFCPCWLCSIISHGMLFWNWGNDESRV